MTQMIIANRLTDGLVVFLTADGAWTESIADGHLIADESEATKWLDIGNNAVRECAVIDPQLIEVEETNGERRPTSYREEIRARGPSIRVEAG